MLVGKIFYHITGRNRMTKAEIRKSVLAIRKNVEERDEKDFLIASCLMSQKFYKEAKTIMVYISYNGEVDTHKLIENMLKDGKKLCAPKCISKEIMEACAFERISDLTSGAYGILEPCGEEVKDIDLVIVPGVAFNENLHRIGYGAGYYDRFLDGFSGITCGLFYEIQKNDFKNDERDKQLDYIITEKYIYEREKK